MSLKKILLTSVVAGVISISSGCAAPLIWGMMEVTGANKYYRAVEKAEARMKENEKSIEEKISNNSLSQAYNEEKSKQLQAETANKIIHYEGRKDSLDELEKALNGLRKEIVLPNLEARTNIQSKSIPDLKNYFRKLRGIRASFGSYVNVAAGNYFYAYTNRGNILGSIPELNSMKSELSQYKDDSNATIVLREVEETLQVALNFKESEAK